MYFFCKKKKTTRSKIHFPWVLPQSNSLAISLHLDIVFPFLRYWDLWHTWKMQNIFVSHARMVVHKHTMRLRCNLLWWISGLWYWKPLANFVPLSISMLASCLGLWCIQCARDHTHLKGSILSVACYATLMCYEITEATTENECINTWESSPLLPSYKE